MVGNFPVLRSLLHGTWWYLQPIIYILKSDVTFLFLSQRLQYVRNVILYNSLNLKK